MANRSVRTAVVAVASLALGVGVTAAVASVRGDDGTATDESLTATPLPIGEPADLPKAASGVDPGRPADSPEGAVTAFLDAEAAQDFADSYVLLAATDREEYRTAAGWLATHADVLPPVTHYTIEDTTAGEQRATVVTRTGFEPSLDQVIGLVPERAIATWVVVAEDGGWLVALQESSFEPLHPPQEDAAQAVRTWGESHQRCEPEGEHAPVLGRRALAEQLCDTAGPVQVDGVEPFTEGFDTHTFLAAYGSGVLEWARVVVVTDPVPLRAVVAPIGQDWQVIGVMEPEGASSTGAGG